MNRRVVSGIIPNPAPGTDFAYTFSQVEEVRLISLMASFVTSATVDSRRPTLTLLGRAGDIVYQAGTATAQTATASNSFLWSPAFSTAIAAVVGFHGSGMGIAWPDLWLPPGWAVASNTAVLQAADQWSNITWAAEFRDSPSDDGALASYLQTLG